jgi:ABC-type Fe3+ transport system permease subunit
MENTTNTTPAQNDGKGLGIAGLVVGIIAVLFSFIPCLGAWAIVPAIVGIVLSAISMRQANKAGMPKGTATGGLVCSIIAAAIAIYWIYAMMYAVAAAPDMIKEMNESGVMDSLNKAMEKLKDITDSTNNEH